MQFAFTSRDGSALECTLAFGSFDYANLDFHEFARRDVPLHLSFRLRRQVMVYNQFIAGEWGPERPTPLNLSAESMTVRVEFFLNVATVVVDGIRVGTFELPEATDGTGEAVHWVTFNGGVDDVKLEGEAFEARQGRGLLLSDRPFLLEGWGFDPASIRQDLAVQLAGTDERLPLAVLPEPERAQEQVAPSDKIGVLSLVPGWIWTHVDAQAESVEVQLTANGRTCGAPLRLTREQMAETIERVCASGAGSNTLELLTALEHARFGNLAGGLSQKARGVLTEVAERYNVTAFFVPPQEAPIGAIRPTPRPGSDTGTGGPLGRSAPAETDAGQDEEPFIPEQVRTAQLEPVQVVLKDISARMAGLADEDMLEVVKQHGLPALPRDKQRDLLLIVARKFCHADRFEDLYTLASDAGLADMPAGVNDWKMSFCLPYLYRNEQGAELTAAIKALPKFNGWVDSCGLGWTMQRVLLEQPAFLAEHQREDMLAGFLGFLQVKARDYFSNLHSHSLVATAVAALQALPTQSEDQQDRTVDALITFYGRSPRFWSMVLRLKEAGRLRTLPQALAAAQEHFWAMSEALDAHDPALGLSELPLTGADARRMRREMAAAVQSGGTPVRKALALSQTGLRAGSQMLDDAVLRHLAFPSEMSDMSDMADTALRAVRRRTTEVPRSLHPEQQIAAGHNARRLLERPVEDTRARTALLDAFFTECALLGSWRDEYLGHALAVSLLTGALTNRDAALAREIPQRMPALLKQLDETELDSVTAAAGVRNALWGLRQAPGAARSEAASAVFDLYQAALPHLPEPFEADDTSLVPTSGLAAFYGILVVVYSCRPNLDTRIAAQRRTWLKDLDDLGVPYIVIVGDGDGRREGDVVYLEAPDSYEALPQKTLAMAEWATRNTGFAHIYKIDDDCYLDAERAIGALNYFKYAYFGRRLYRAPGDMDRIWHHSRGATGNSTMEIDKSPEPAEYADGSTGYVLNRRAMQDLVDTSKTRHGAWLRLVSFMEDKLVGDTLALSGISLSNRDYHSCILRRNHSKGMSVCRWENGFLPSKASPALVAHLDNAALLGRAAETRQGAALLPKRLWPSHQTVDLGSHNRQLELVSPQDKLNSVNAADLCVVACVRNERQMLPMFLEHYRNLGVQGFLISDNCSDDGTLEYLAEQPDVATFSAETEYSLTHYGVAWQHSLISQLRMNRWSLVADADEFLVLPEDVSTLPELVALPGFAAADCARIFMLDLYPEGPLTDATLESGDPFSELTHCDRSPFTYAWDPGPYDDAPTWTSALRHRLLEGSRSVLYVAQKCALIRYKPWMRFSDGLHYAAEVTMAPRDLIFAHFKYHAAFHERARVETARAQHFNGAEEYRKYLALMAEGRDRVFDPAFSVPWRESAWVKRVLSAPGTQPEGAARAANRSAAAE